MTEHVLSRRAILKSTGPAVLGAYALPANAAVSKPPSLLAESLPLESVRLLPSPYRTAMEANLNYLHLLDPDRLLHNYRAQAGLKPKGAVYGGWESESIAGHTLGHYLSACAHMHAQTGDEECKKRVGYIVGELTLCQSPDGYVGGFTRKKDGESEAGKVIFDEIRRGDIHATAFNLNGAWSPLYNLHKLFAGLLDADRYCDAGKAITVAERLGGYLNSVFSTLTPSQMQSVLACEYGGLNETFAELYARTKNRTWLHMSESLYDNAVLDPLAARRDDIAYLHSNTTIPKLIGLARLYELTGDERYSVASLFFWKEVTAKYSYVIGGNGDREYFQAPMTISTHITEQTCETCSSYNMLKLTRHLYAQHPSAAYFDYFERTHLNHILAQQNPKTGMFAYMTPLMSGTHREYSTPYDDFWCCVGTGLESHAKHGESIYWRVGDNLFVNLFIPSTLNWATQKTKLELTTAYPLDGTINLKFIEREMTEPLTVALRIPGWCKDPILKLNGGAITQHVEAGYIHLRRIWAPGDVLTLILPLQLRPEPTPDDRQTLALFYGPLVMGGDLGPAASTWTGTVPALVGEDVLSGVSQQAGHAVFRTEGTVRPTDLTLKPFAFLHERNAAVYFQHYTEAGWIDKLARDKAEVERRRQIIAQSADVITLGQEASERKHNLQSENSYSVVYRGEHGRDARAGGYVQFMMKTQPGPLMLAARYWGEERNRRFRILVDGTVIAREQLDGTHPARFFERDYAIPQNLTAGKQRIVVRFEPEPDVTAGPVFGVRLFRAKAG